MTFIGKTAVAVMFLIVLVGTLNGIRSLKDVPNLGPDTTLYKLSTPTTSAVQVQCTEDAMVIKVRADFYGNGHRVTADQIQLGPGRSTDCQAIRLNDVEYVIEAGLHECGSEIWTEGDDLIYANTLFYTPTPSKVGIVRSAETAVRVQCRYKRTHFVSSNNQRTLTWQQSLAYTKPSPWFCLKLMTDDWRSKRPLSVYHWGNVINMEASVMSADQTPLKLFLDSCVATLGPNSRSTTRYPIIHNHGCVAEPSSSLPGPSVCLVPRTEDHVLRVQVDVLRFYGDDQNAVKTIYITCVLKVTDAALPENSLNKACTFSGNRWQSVDGNHKVCECCESTCDVMSQRQASIWSQRPVSSATSDSRSAVVTVGPVIIRD